MQQLSLDVAERTLTDEQACETLREAIVSAMTDGQLLALRYNAAAPDFMCNPTRPTVLPAFAFTAASMQPGPISMEAAAMLRPRDGTADSFKVQDGFHLIVISAFDMNGWKRYLRGKIPIGEFQPVQTCSTLIQVAAVMKDGLPRDTTDDDLDKMDRLGDML